MAGFVKSLYCQYVDSFTIDHFFSRDGIKNKDEAENINELSARIYCNQARRIFRFWGQRYCKENKRIFLRNS